MKNPVETVVAAIMPVRVWAMGDCDWVAARTKTEAIDCYLQFCGESRDEALRQGVEPLTDADMRRLTFVTDEEEEGVPSSYKRHSFAVELKRLIDSGAQFPRFFASTEF